MEISSCVIYDVEDVFNLYEQARLFQTEKNMVLWPLFAKKFIENEIINGQQWKAVVDGKIACNWTITLADKDIWEEKENGDAIYIHRIATDQNFRGNNFVTKIVEWAKAYAIENKRKYIRLDTLGDNTKLIQHYTKLGFTFLGIVKLKNTKSLPVHYQIEPNCCLFEIVV